MKKGDLIVYTSRRGSFLSKYPCYGIIEGFTEDKVLVTDSRLNDAVWVEVNQTKLFFLQVGDQFKMNPNDKDILSAAAFHWSKDNSQYTLWVNNLNTITQVEIRHTIPVDKLSKVVLI